MTLRIFLLFILSLTATSLLFSQTGTIKGTIYINDNPVEYADIYIETLNKGASSLTDGSYTFTDIPLGSHTLIVSFIGYKDVKRTIQLSTENNMITTDFHLTEEVLSLDEIVVSGTKTFKRKTNSPIIVGVLSEKALDEVQACSLSDGLKFQPGLRVETDCQTCNYTQLRMNGLAGGYSQILINGRPIFSPLTGLYGMEQLPVNMIDRIEIIRGGGSSLYGSSAIGGTVNVITKVPKKNNYSIDLAYQRINGKANDLVLNGNATILSEKKQSGVSFFINRRDRQWYDHNADNFSEIPLLNNTSVGANAFFLPKENQKLELSLSNLREYRYGGEMLAGQPAHLALQSEERDHDVWMGSLDYQFNMNNENTSLISYLAWQQTDRKHYTGIRPDANTSEDTDHLSNPPYGISDVTTYNVGLQLNHRINQFWIGSNTLTVGIEYIYDDVFDVIPAYNYKIDQTTKDLGAFIQSDWALSPSVTLLSGLRVDKHNLVNNPVWSPRLSLLYKHSSTTQLRLNYGTGFRAPQAFDTDLHIAFAGGGISRVTLAPDLLPEHSNSYSASINYDRPADRYIAGFTIEGFYTQLDRAFVLDPIGEDKFGEVFQKINGQGATVQGVTVELRANYDKKVQIEAGFTLQSSRFDDPVQYIDELPGIKDFIRTPNDYGFATLSVNPTKRLKGSLNYIYTGHMKIPHFAGAPNQTVDEIITSPHFSELGAKLSYTLPVNNSGTALELYGGVKNLFNSYQQSFDIGKNRDSNFVFGPGQPRTIYLGIKWKG